MYIALLTYHVVSIIYPSNFINTYDSNSYMSDIITRYSRLYSESFGIWDSVILVVIGCCEISTSAGVYSCTNPTVHSYSLHKGPINSIIQYCHPHFWATPSHEMFQILVWNVRTEPISIQYLGKCNPEQTWVMFTYVHSSRYLSYNDINLQIKFILHYFC